MTQPTPPSLLSRVAVVLRATVHVCVVLVAFAVLPVSVNDVSGQSLRGGTRSMDRQTNQAVRHDFTYLRTASHVQRFVELGLLVRVATNSNFTVRRVSFPYARPEVVLFLNRLGRQYQNACGEPLVVTSLTRPKSRQPRNASDRSVHPTGMAVDLRRSSNAKCRRWLEDTLIYLEDQNVLEATRERRPPHYHVAIFPQSYSAYVERITGQQATRVAATTSSATGAEGAASHRVRRGETLWDLAQRYGTTVSAIRSMNGIGGSRILAGQTLKVPLGR